MFCGQDEVDYAGASSRFMAVEGMSGSQLLKREALIRRGQASERQACSLGACLDYRLKHKARP